MKRKSKKAVSPLAEIKLWEWAVTIVATLVIVGTIL